MSENLIDRRQALTKMSATTLSLMSACVAFIGGGFLYPVPKKKQPPLFVCMESEVPDKKPLEIEDLRGRKVLLMRKPGGKIVAISTVCSHLGCVVFYRPDKKHFECPCHQGYFDENGNPIAGPPQRPLEHFKTEVRNGKIFIQFT